MGSVAVASPAPGHTRTHETLLQDRRLTGSWAARLTLGRTYTYRAIARTGHSRG